MPSCCGHLHSKLQKYLEISSSETVTEVGVFSSVVIYESIFFWILYPLLLIPAIVLGLKGKRIAPYALIVSLLLIPVIYHGWQLLEFLMFLGWQIGCVFGYRLVHERVVNSSQKLRLTYFWVFLLASMLPLVTCRILEVGITSTLIGFLGISYITFRSLQMIIEVYDGLITELNLGEFLAFMTFFATISSGPIDRSRRFHGDYTQARSREEYSVLLVTGLRQIFLGLIYNQGIATFLAPWVSAYYFKYTLPDIIFYAYCYTFYLFFDFAGYSLMAVGTSKIFGIDTPMNFHKPFLAKDIKDFWNRWHITLSHWFRDYIFNRFIVVALKKKLFKNRLSAGFCGYMINMTIMGFWHGITYSYIAYGLYHGLLLGLTDVYQKKTKFHKKHKNSKVYQVCCVFVTFNLVVFSLLLFSGQFTHVLRHYLLGAR